LDVLDSPLPKKTSWASQKKGKEYDLNIFIPRDKVMPRAEKKEEPRGNGARNGEKQ
jgi:hypothetical protein